MFNYFFCRMKSECCNFKNCTHLSSKSRGIYNRLAGDGMGWAWGLSRNEIPLGNVWPSKWKYITSIVNSTLEDPLQNFMTVFSFSRAVHWWLVSHSALIPQIVKIGDDTAECGILTMEGRTGIDWLCGSDRVGLLIVVVILGVAVE